MSVNLCACQTKKQTNKKDTKTQLTMVLDWTPNTNHTGLYVAEQKGYFADEGLEVEIVLPPDDGATDMVVSGNAEFGIDAQDNLAEEFAGDQNINVTAVAAILQHNTAGLISSTDQGIDSPGKLQDHTLATNDTLFRQKVIQTLVEADGGDFGRVTLLSVILTMWYRHSVRTFNVRGSIMSGVAFNVNRPDWLRHSCRFDS